MKEKLFAVFLGGRAPGCHIELHDVVFVVSTGIEQSYSTLIKKWFGSPNRLHIDSYIELEHVDGYKITLLKEPKASKGFLKLFFINFGGYKSNFFGEIHESGFYVAKDKNEALRRARHDLCVGSVLQHRDDVLEVTNTVKNVRTDVDDILELSTLDGYHLHLEPLSEAPKPKIVSDYIKIADLAE